jgi:hypothetical protein
MKVRIGWEERFKLNKKIIVSQSWLAIAYEVRTRIIRSEADIFIPELEYHSNIT